MAGELPAALIRAEVESLAASAGLTSAPRRVSLLRFLVEEELSGRGQEIKETVIAAEVLGLAGYDSERQSVVRGEMRRLRLALLEHYSERAGAAAVVVSIPKGSYRPQFTVREPFPVPAAVPVWRWVAIGILVAAGLVVGLVRTPKFATEASPPDAISLLIRQGHRDLDLRTPASLSKARTAFEEATKQEPSNVAGWGGLALTLAITDANGLERPSEIAPAAVQAARRALDLDPSYTDAHTALGVIKTFYEWDWTGAEYEYRTAIASNPEDANAHLAYAMHLLIRQRFSDALAEIRRAQELEPDSFAVNRGAFMVRLHSGEVDEAIAEAVNAAQRSPGSEVRHLVSMALQWRAASQGNWDEMRRVRLTIVPDFRQSAWYNKVTMEASRHVETRDDAQRLYSNLLELSSRRYLPSVVLMAGHHDAFGTLGDWPDRCYQERDATLVWFQRWPRGVRYWEVSPEYSVIRRRMGLLD